MKKWLSIGWIIGFIILGVAVVMLGSKFKAKPKQVDDIEFATKAKTISVPNVKLKISAIGYGRVQATEYWDAVAEVTGKIVFISEKLKNGEFISKGEKLMVIDPSSYQLALAQIEAQINTSKIKHETTKLSIKTRQQELALLEKEFARQKKLASKGNISRSTLDNTERNLLAVKGGLQTLENNLLINTSEQQVLLIQRQQAQQDLQKTRIVAVLDARITEVKVGESQFINRGQLLFKADAIAAAEIETQMPMGKLKPLVGGSKNQLKNVDAGSSNWVPGVKGMSARISVKNGDHSVHWNAVISRVSATVDPQTQSLGVVARVENPYKQAVSGRRPPLIKDMFVEVELFSSNQKKYVVVPSSAIHEGHVYLLDDEQRLQLRQVDVNFYQQGYAAIAKGLEPGDKIITSDLVPAIEGMLLKPVDDKKAKMKLMMAATGMSASEIKQKRAKSDNSATGDL